MNFGNLLSGQPDNIKKSLRNIESIEKKLANIRIAAVFNQTCLNEYIYIYIYIHVVIGSIRRVIKISFHKRSTFWIIIN